MLMYWLRERVANIIKRAESCRRLERRTTYLDHPHMWTISEARPNSTRQLPPSSSVSRCSGPSCPLYCKLLVKLVPIIVMALEASKIIREQNRQNALCVYNYGGFASVRQIADTFEVSRTTPLRRQNSRHWSMPTHSLFATSWLDAFLIKLFSCCSFYRDTFLPHETILYSSDWKSLQSPASHLTILFP
jgi:hypothetical protein